MVNQYKCPDCGSDMKFDAQTGTLHCENCGHSEAISADNGSQDEFSAASMTAGLDTYGDEASMYTCKNCGASLAAEKNASSAVCSFCGAPMVLTDRLAGALKPNKVIPFKIDKQHAEEAFRNWAGSGRFVDDNFKPANRIKDLKGVYIPYWLFDLHAKGNTVFEATKVKEHDEGNYHVKETEYYDVTRTADLRYLRVPADASEKMDDKAMDLLEPFDYSSLNAYAPEYLAGYQAEVYDKKGEDLVPRVKERVTNYYNQFVRDSVKGYDSVNVRRSNINVSQLKKPDYALIPVWVVAYDFKDKEHTFLMNGQTGKIVGKPPISKGKVAAWMAGMTAVFFGIAELLINFVF